MPDHHIGRIIHRRIVHERHVRIIATAMIVLTLVAGCGEADPTVTPVSKTPPPTATQTPIPPTAEPSLTATPTVEPSPTATPTVELSPTVVAQETVASPSPAVADISAYITDLASQDQFAGTVLVAQQGESIFKRENTCIRKRRELCQTVAGSSICLNTPFFELQGSCIAVHK